MQEPEGLIRINQEIVKNRLSSLRGLVMLFGCLLMLVAVFNTGLNIYRVVQLDAMNKRLNEKLHEYESNPQIISATCGSDTEYAPSHIAEDPNHAD